MHLATHFFISWLGANTDGLERRDRALVTLAGIILDADALGIVRDIVAPIKGQPLYWYAKYHHVIGHNIFLGLAATLACFALARKKWKTAFLALLVFHVHLLADLAGSGGPQGGIWPIHYLYPVIKKNIIIWNGQWALNAWPNVVITIVAIAVTLCLGAKRGYTPVEMLSVKADRAVVGVLRKWIPV
jgi:inner membrane protein